jgi:Trypsin-co-occurring domain 1
MKTPIELKLANNPSVLRDANDTNTLARPRVGRRRDHDTKTAIHRVENAIQPLQPAVAALLQICQKINMPNDLALECGIRFQANTGAWFASVSRQATVKMLLKWVKKR